MEKDKKVKQEQTKSILTVFLVLVIALGFIGGFELASDLKERLYRIDNGSETKESDDIAIAGKQGNMILGFDEKYVESDEDLDYQLNFGTYAGSNGAYFTVGFGNTKNELVVNKYFYDSEESQEYTMSFAANVVDVHYGQFRNDPNYSTLFFLLDNGDVCYSLIEDMVKDNEYGFYTTIENLSNIVKFYNGDSCDPELGTCNSTTFAQANNGVIYDLNNYIK